MEALGVPRSVASGVSVSGGLDAVGSVGGVHNLRINAVLNSSTIMVLEV